MAVPRFFDRIADAALPVFGPGTLRQKFYDRLASSAVTLQARLGMEEHPVERGGFLLAANLCARLYPRIRLDGERELTDSASELILAINPTCDVSTSSASTDAAMSWQGSPATEGVFVTASGWNAMVDVEPPERSRPVSPAILVAAALGVGELFRTVFADLLQSRGRRAPALGGFNLVTLERWSDTSPALNAVDLGTFHLVGAGAVGEAAVLTLREAGVSGQVIAVDDQVVTLSNLQRYVLASDGDEDAKKTDLVQAALTGSSLSVIKIPSRWGHDERAMAGRATTVLVGVDNAQGRIDLQAGLPVRIFNAFTGPLDLGWSRHERFGIDPCLACLYWPDRIVPSRHEVIADALGEHPLRVLMYLLNRIPVGMPLGPIVAPMGMQVPVGAESWHRRSLLEDIAQRASMSDVDWWSTASVEDLYHEGICGGGIVYDETPRGSGELVVPLAHQSCLAGIMLASQLLIASTPEVAALRSPAIEARYDVLAPPQQMLARPRLRTEGCLCWDPDFLSRHGAYPQN